YRPKLTPRLVIDPSRPTTRKLRFVSEHHSTHLLRADWERAVPIGPKIETAMIKAVRGAIRRADAVVLSDYAKGLLTPRLIRSVIAIAKKHKKPVIVDPKGLDFSIYRGATIITPNSKELLEATHRNGSSPAELAAAAAELARDVKTKAVLVTMSEQGMLLHQPPKKSVHVPAYPVKVRDV